MYDLIFAGSLVFHVSEEFDSYADTEFEFERCELFQGV